MFACGIKVRGCYDGDDRRRMAPRSGRYVNLAREEFYTRG